VAKVDLTSFKKQMAQVEAIGEDLPRAAYKHFVEETPIKSGNARRRTTLQQTKIVADYPYSQRLDEGASKQAPKGMVAPTEQWIQQEVDRRLKGL
jgi:hypothetical protein